MALERDRLLAWALALLSVLLFLAAATSCPSEARAASRLAEFLGKVQAAELDPAADRFGEVEGDPPAAKLLKGDRLVGYAFLNADIVDSTGYSGKPINIVVGIDLEGRITGAKLVEHHEPIVLVGIPQAKIVHYIDGFIGRRVLDAGAAEQTPVDIVSGATVSMMVIADSMMQSAVRIARSRGLGGAGAQVATASPAPRQIDLSQGSIESWKDLLGDGAVRRLAISNKEIDDLFRRSGNAAAIAHPQAGDPNADYIDLYVALVSIPAVGRSLLGEAEYARLASELKPGQRAVLIAGDGPYSFRGSGYVRGGIFDRIEVTQSENSIRFRDRHYRRIGDVAAAGAPDFPEIGLFLLPEGSHFDPVQPWRLQLLVQRATGALDIAIAPWHARGAARAGPPSRRQRPGRPMAGLWPRRAPGRRRSGTSPAPYSRARR